MDSWVIIAFSLFAITIALTILDLYPMVRSFWFLGTQSYYIFLLCFFGPNFGAAWILKTQVFENGDLVTILVVSSLAAFLVIQNFTLQVAGQKVIDLSEMFNRFKATVVNDAGKLASKKERQRITIAAKKLSGKYKNNIGELQTELYLLLAQTLRPNQAQSIVSGMNSHARQAGVILSRLLADRIAQIDLDRAQLLVKDC